MLTRTRLVLAAVLVLAAFGVAAALKLPRFSGPLPSRDTTAVAIADVLPALEGASGWLNGDRGVLDSLRGNPVVIAVWSDTDPRCLDGLPRVEGWNQAYRRFGVHVIGVYAPDFSFGVDSTVPLRLAQRLGLGFPIALDPSYLVRSRLASIVSDRAILLLGPDARVIATFGFDDLDRVDRALRDALRRLRPDLDFPSDPEPATSPPPRDIRIVHLGAGRVSEGPLASAASGRTETFTTQFRFQEEGKSHVPIPVGRWTPTAEGTTAARGGAADFVAFRDAGDRVDVVLSPRAEGSSRVWILADDGWLPASDRGADVRVDSRGASYVDVDEPRLYAIAKGGKSHVLRLSPEQPGLTIHALVFEKAPANP